MSVITVVACLLLAGHAAPPLAAARIAPPDVDALVQVRDGLQAPDAGSRALAEGVCSMLDAVGAREGWKQAAAAAGISPWALFQRCAGRDASLLVRRGAQGPEWVLALEIPSREACELLRSMGGRMQGASRFSLPQLGLEGAVAGEWLLVSDRADGRLLRDILRVSSEAGQPTLAEALPQGALQPSEARVSVALRHGGSVKGHSVWRASADASGVHVEVLAALDRDPLGELRDGGVSGEELTALPEETMACWVQSMPRHPVPAAWWRAQPAWKPDAAVEGSLGRRMLVAVGPRHDGEGSAALAVAYELTDAEAGTRAADALLDRVAGCCATPATAPCTVLARRHGASLEAPRSWDAPALVGQAFAGLEPLGGAELHARTVILRHGGWRVYASDDHWLRRVAGSLEELPEGAAHASVDAARVGHAQGGALAPVLAGWAQVRELAGGCGGPMRFLSAMLRRSGEVSWQVSAQGPGRWRGQVDLAPPMPSEAEAVQVADRPLPQ